MRNISFLPYNKCNQILYLILKIQSHFLNIEVVLLDDIINNFNNFFSHLFICSKHAQLQHNT